MIIAIDHRHTFHFDKSRHAVLPLFTIGNKNNGANSYLLTFIAH